MFFRVLPKICLSLIPTERGRFSRCFPKYSQFLYIPPGREPFLSGFRSPLNRQAAGSPFFHPCFEYSFTYSDWERMFQQVFSKKVLFPQRVASEKVRNVRVPRNYFSLHLFPVRKAIWRGAFKKFLSQRVASEKTVFYLCFEYFFTCSHLERSKVVPASKFSSSRGRSREKP